MLRLFLLALLIWSALRLVGRWLGAYLPPRNPDRFSSRGQRRRSTAGGPAGPPSSTAGVLARCPTCGVHFAPGGSSPAERQGFCSESCRKTAPQA